MASDGGISTKDGRVTVPVDDEKLQQFDDFKAIGKGKFSTVFRALRKDTGKHVALKRIQIFDMMDEKSREKCLKEIHLVRSVSHQNIIAFYDAFIVQKELWLVFEYAEAGDLKRQLRKARERKARFDERVVWKYFSQVAAAVAHMHERHVMHRDLKPANIFLTLNGTVKVGDLGLGRYLSEQTLEAHSKVGTPLYMSPEVLQGKGYDYKSDVWSLGCVLYELAMLLSPFKEEGLNLYGLFQKISNGTFPPVSDVYSGELQALVAGMLAQNPGDRPDMQEVARASAAMLGRCEEQRRQVAAAAAAAQADAAAGSTPAGRATPQALDPEAAAAEEIQAQAAEDNGGTAPPSEGKDPPPDAHDKPPPSEGKQAEAPAPQPAAAGQRGAGGARQDLVRPASAARNARGRPPAPTPQSPLPTALGTGGAVRKGVLSGAGDALSAGLLQSKDALELSAQAVGALQCLGYEQHWAEVKDVTPLHPFYFAIPHTDGASSGTLGQFQAFGSLVSWCVSICRGPRGLLAGGPTPRTLGDAQGECVDWGPDGMYAPPPVLGQAVTTALEGVGMSAPLSDACLPRDVAAGHGLAPCRCLAFAALTALAHAGWVWRGPSFANDGGSVEEDDGADAAADVAAAGDGIAEDGPMEAGSDSEEEQVLFSEGKAGRGDADELGGSARRIMRSGVPAAEWNREVERAKGSMASRLKALGLSNIAAAAEAGGGSWRGHMAATMRHYRKLTGGVTGGVRPPLASLGALERTAGAAEEAAARVRAAETRMNAEAGGGGGLVGEHWTLSAAASAAGERVASLGAAVGALAEAVAATAEEAADMAEAVAARGDSVSDASPLQRIRTALAALRKENQGLHLRLGIALQRWEGANARRAEERRNHARRSSLARGGDGGDSDLEVLSDNDDGYSV